MNLRIILRFVLSAAAVTTLLVVGAALAAPQIVQQQTSDQVFKNVQVLKGIPVDEKLPGSSLKVSDSRPS